jgi:hypothetical protein
MTTKLLMGMSLAIAMLFAAASFAQNRPIQERAGQDKASQKFLTEAIEGNLAEVQMGATATAFVPTARCWRRIIRRPIRKPPPRQARSP